MRQRLAERSVVAVMGLWAALWAGLGVAAPVAARHASTATTAGPAPCTSASAACTEWVALGSGPARSMVYRTFPLTRLNPRIHRALIMIHGTLRNGDHYFTTATGAAFLGKALDDTVVIAPAIRSAAGPCKDVLAPHEVSWSCTGDSWRSGGQAASDPALTSFDFVDQIIRLLADHRVFPNLKVVVVAGHSAGGQFVSRYEMSNRIHDAVGVRVEYVVANPSSYAWPAATRALPVADGAPDKAVAAWSSEEPHTDFQYGIPDKSKAPAYDRWPYGFEDRTSGYAAKIGDDQLRRQLAARPTTYLLGQVDVLPLGGFDDSPSAMAQGATRRARGEAFVHYLNTRLGGHAKVKIVPECGHNDRCIFTTDEVLPVLFPPAGG